MKIKQLFFTTLSAFMLLSLYGCGGDDTVSDSRNQTGSNIQTGVLIDSPIINIGYRTETQEGVTNAQGEYNFLPGETVTFFIGDLEFPTVTATGIVTPLDLADTQDINDPTVINMIRLIQTLDKNGNPDDGIEITEIAKSSATQVDFSLDVTTFESSIAVIALVTNGGQDTTVTELVLTEDAIQHFEQQLVDNDIIEDPALLAFTAEELNGLTVYDVFNNQPDCPTSGWYVEAMSFNAGNYTLNVCDGTVETGTYTVTASGLLNIIADGGGINEFIKRVSFNVMIGDWSECWANTEDGASQCTNDERSIIFIDQAAAEAFVADRNTGAALDCTYDSGWNDTLNQPATFNSYNDFIEVVTACGGVLTTTTGDIIGTTWEVVWDGAGSVEQETYVFNSDNTVTITATLDGNPDGEWTLGWSVNNNLVTIDGVDYIDIWAITPSGVKVYTEESSWSSDFILDATADGEIWDGPTQQ